MPIEITGVAAVAGLDAASGAAAKSARPSAPQTPQDTASISQQARTLSVPALTRQALSASGARAAKVEALQHAVASTAYRIDPSLIAEAILASSV